MRTFRRGLFVLLSLAIPCQALALELGQSVGKIGLTTLAGERFDMSNYDERPATAVLFLSSRCETTHKSIAEISRLYNKYRYRDVLIVGVSSNATETDNELRQFAQHAGLIFPLYHDRDGSVARQFAAQRTPEIFLLDKQGQLVFHGGLQDAQGLAAYEAAVNALLRKQPIAPTSYAVAGTAIGAAGTPRLLDDPYGTISFAAEMVFEKIPQAPAHHCSTICQAGNGDLLCLWYGGTYESAHDQVLFLARKKSGDKSWGTPQVLLENGLQPPGNGVIFRDVGDRLCIVWCRMEGTRPMRRGSGWDRCRLFHRTSTDHGVTWSEDRPMFDETLWCVPRNPPITLTDGMLVLPVEGLQGNVEGSYFLTRAAADTPWKRAGFTSGGSQPAVIQRNDSSLLAMLRHGRFITRIESRDAGQTWTDAQPTPLQNPDSGISMVRLANGHLLLVYNDSQTKRTPLSIVRSIDEGASWEKPQALESNPGEYSYPCIIQTADGHVHVTYTFRRYAIKHVEFNENWLTQFERPD